MTHWQRLTDTHENLQKVFSPTLNWYLLRLLVQCIFTTEFYIGECIRRSLVTCFLLFLWSIQTSSVQFSRSVVSDSLRPHESQHARLSITNSRSSPRLTSIESLMPSSHLILCRPLLLLPPIPPSISLFQWVNSAWGGQSTGVSDLERCRAFVINELHFFVEI